MNNDYNEILNAFPRRPFSLVRIFPLYKTILAVALSSVLTIFSAISIYIDFYIDIPRAKNARFLLESGLLTTATDVKGSCKRNIVHHKYGDDEIKNQCDLQLYYSDINNIPYKIQENVTVYGEIDNLKHNIGEVFMPNRDDLAQVLYAKDTPNNANLRWVLNGQKTVNDQILSLFWMTLFFLVMVFIGVKSIIFQILLNKTAKEPKPLVLYLKNSMGASYIGRNFSWLYKKDDPDSKRTYISYWPKTSHPFWINEDEKTALGIVGPSGRPFLLDQWLRPLNVEPMELARLESIVRRNTSST